MACKSARRRARADAKAFQLFLAKYRQERNAHDTWLMGVFQTLISPETEEVIAKSARYVWEGRVVDMPDDFGRLSFSAEAIQRWHQGQPG